MMKYEYIGNKSGGILFELTGIRYTRTHCGNSRGQFGISTVCVMFKFSWDFWKLWTLNAQKFPDANGFVMLCPKTQVDHQLAVQTDNDQSWLNAVILIPGKPLPYHAISMFIDLYVGSSISQSWVFPKSSRYPQFSAGHGWRVLTASKVGGPTGPTLFKAPEMMGNFLGNHPNIPILMGYPGISHCL